MEEEKDPEATGQVCSLFFFDVLEVSQVFVLLEKKPLT